MDKFMIDKYIQPKQIDKALEIHQPIEHTHTYYEPKIYDNKVILEEPVQEQTSYRLITIIGLILFICYAIYYAVKTMYNKNKYLIKKNATTLEITLDELKIDVKNFIKEKYEGFLDWKENWKTSSNKFMFKKYLDNGGAFKATKRKAKNLLSHFIPKND